MAECINEYVPQSSLSLFISSGTHKTIYLMPKIAPDNEFYENGFDYELDAEFASYRGVSNNTYNYGNYGAVYSNGTEYISYTNYANYNNTRSYPSNYNYQNSGSNNDGNYQIIIGNHRLSEIDDDDDEYGVNY